MMYELKYLKIELSEKTGCQRESGGDHKLLRGTDLPDM